MLTMLVPGVPAVTPAGRPAPKLSLTLSPSSSSSSASAVKVKALEVSPLVKVTLVGTPSSRPPPPLPGWWSRWG